MKGYIYKIYNDINNKLYIGQTVQTLGIRFTNHKMASKLEKTKLYNAFNKYGIENFHITLIEEVEDYNLLNEREKYWINYYDSYNNGYNSTLGGDGVHLIDYNKIYEKWQEGKSRKEISDEFDITGPVVSKILNNFGISSEEIQERGYDKHIRNITSEKAYNLWLQGFTPNQIAKKEGSTLHTVKKLLFNYNLTEEDFKKRATDNQKKYSSDFIYEKWQEGLCIQEIVKKYGSNQATIKKQLLEFNIGSEEINQRFRQKCNKNKKAVVQLDLQGNFVNQFDSALQASKITGTASQSISGCCNHKPKYKTANGFKWEFLDNYLNKSEEKR